MNEMKKQNSDVYVADSQFVAAAKSDMDFFIEHVDETTRGRMRLCAHKDEGDRLQEMFIALSRSTYLQPSYHTKDESLHVLDGKGSYVFFDDKGAVIGVVPLGPYGSGRSFYCRIPRNTYHALVVESDVIMIHEITSGPFLRSETIFAPWAPGDESPDLPAYRAWLDSVVAKGRAAPARAS